MKFRASHGSCFFLELNFKLEDASLSFSFFFVRSVKFAIVMFRTRRQGKSEMKKRNEGGKRPRLNWEVQLPPRRRRFFQFRSKSPILPFLDLTLASASLIAPKSIMLAPIPAPWKKAVAAAPRAAAFSEEEELLLLFFDDDNEEGIRTGRGGSMLFLFFFQREREELASESED